VQPESVRWTPIKDVPRWAWKFIRSEMFGAKKGCRHCKGRGQTGTQKISLPSKGIFAGDPVFCRCTMVNMAAVEASRDHPNAAKLLDEMRRQVAKIRAGQLNPRAMAKQGKVLGMNL